MLLSGIPVPKLGSIQDRTIRAFMHKKGGQEIAKTKLLAQIAISSGGSDKSWARNISNIWGDYLRATYYLEAEREELQQDLTEQYKQFSHLRPKLVIAKGGGLALKGIPKSKL